MRRKGAESPVVEHHDPISALSHIRRDPPTLLVQAPSGYNGTYLRLGSGQGDDELVDGTLPEAAFADGLPSSTNGTSQGMTSSVRRHGRGIMVYSDRTVYEGDWLNDERHGNGICYFPSGNIYVGQFEHGHMHGEGSMLYFDGDFFTGGFRESVCHGIGVFYSGGTEVRGEWRDGVRIATTYRRDVTSVEDFDAQRVHYETFGAVLRQLHGHFAYYALFDNRFRRSSDFPSHLRAPQKPASTGATLGRNAMASSAVQSREKELSLSIPSVVVNHDRVPSGGTSADHPLAGRSQTGQHLLLPSVVSIPIVASSEDEGIAGHSFLINSGSFHAPAAALTSPLHSTTAAAAAPFPGGKRKKKSANNLSQLRGGGHLRMQGKDGTAGGVSPTVPPSTPLKVQHGVTLSFSGEEMASGGAAAGVGSGIAGPSGDRAPFEPMASTTIATGADTIGATIDNMATLEKQHQHVLQALFAQAGCVTGERLAFVDFVTHASRFLVPFFSLPHIPFCPFTMKNLDVEREYVVSGAALQHDFKPPKSSVYVACLGLLALLAAILIACLKTGITSRMSDRSILGVELIAPAVLWFVFALVCAGYHGYFRIAHPLERLDRRLAPRLAAFAANAVDAVADVCVFTWDEEGRSKITNAHYKYRWLVASVIIGLLIAFATPVTRAAFGQNPFLREEGVYGCAVTGLSMGALFLFGTGIAYYVIKSTDMQRQVLSQLQVLSHSVHMSGVSMVAPSEPRHAAFSFDDPVDCREFFTGFAGWWVTRSFVLGTSACSNHKARSACVSAFIVAQTMLCLVVMGDVVYAGASGQLHSPTSPYAASSNSSSPYYSAAHSIALVLLSTYGVLLGRYLLTAVALRDEVHVQLQLMDAAALWHSVRADMKSAAIVERCRTMAAKHDPLPTIISVPITPTVMIFLLAANFAALAVIWVVFAEAFYNT